VLFENLNYDTFKTLIYELLKGDNVIVIDEFQVCQRILQAFCFTSERKAKLILLAQA